MVTERLTGVRAKVSREALLQAAAAIFFEQGYAATRIDDIIQRAGGSKRNIYDEFGNKEGLFVALVSDHANRALEGLSVEKLECRKLGDMLFAFGRELIDLYMSPALIGVYRIAVTEHARFPQLVREFYDRGPGRASRTLAEILAAAQERGEIGPCNHGVAADHFAGMIRGNAYLQVVLGLRPLPTAEERHQLVTSAVDIFLRGVGRPGIP